MSLLINIDVPDLEKAQGFYLEAFGLTLGRRLGPDVVELLGWPTPLYLLEKDENSTTAGTEARRYHRHWTPVHFDLVVDDLEIAVSRAVRAGALLETPSSQASFGRIAMLADPFGHGFCLIEFNEWGYSALATARPDEIAEPHGTPAA